MFTLPDIEMTVSQYDKSDCEIGRYTGTFISIFDRIPNFERYYYRATVLGKNEAQGRVYSKHFGVRVTSIGGLYLSEESFINNYLNYLIQEYAKCKSMHSSGEHFSFTYLLNHNFWFIDKMKTICQNTVNGFTTSLTAFLDKYPQFQETDNLNDTSAVNGIYLLILDKYNVCYFGQSNDIRKRIMRHWSRNDYFTGTGIDMFKAKDTTRIYFAPTNGWTMTNTLEHHVIDDMPSRYTLNCMAGGDLDFLDSNCASISKEVCADEDYIDYVRQRYSIPERIIANKERFIVLE